MWLCLLIHAFAFLLMVVRIWVNLLLYLGLDWCDHVRWCGLSIWCWFVQLCFNLIWLLRHKVAIYLRLVSHVWHVHRDYWRIRLCHQDKLLLFCVINLKILYWHIVEVSVALVIPCGRTVNSNKPLEHMKAV